MSLILKQVLGKSVQAVILKKCAYLYVKKFGQFDAKSGCDVTGARSMSRETYIWAHNI